MRLKETIVQTPPPPKEPASLSFEQMAAGEGIYRIATKDSYYDNTRWVTLSYGAGFNTFYVAGKEPQSCSPTAWVNTQFIRTDEELQVTIK